MDIQLARTFLEVVAAGSFVGAAERLSISQAAVSTRIQVLEGQLGCTLFYRGRAGAKLTPAGRQFRRYAATMKQLWDQALLEVTLPKGFTGQVRLGGHYSLWRHFLSRWLIWMRKHGQGIALRTEAHGSRTVMELTSDGMLDIGVLFAPEQRAGFVVERLFEEPLVLVSTTHDSTAPYNDGYVFVDWGPEFQRFHIQAFPNLALSGFQTDLGAFAVEHVLESEGSGYFPEPVVRPLLQAGRLHIVKRAPRYVTPIFAVYREGDLGKAVRTALDGLREITHEESKRVSRQKPSRA
jgi:LysR family transcriptional regulator, flagellar master operon regulator